MRTSSVGMYALRLASQATTDSSARAFATASPDRVVTRSATMLAVFGIALSSFSLKQMLSTNNHGRSRTISMRKF